VRRLTEKSGSDGLQTLKRGERTMKKVDGLILDQDEIATAICEFVAKTYPEYADIGLEDVCFLTTEILELGLSRVDAHVSAPSMRKEESDDES